MRIAELFDRDIARRINPVVQVEDRSESELAVELDEYVVTDQIAKSLTRILEDGYLESRPPGVGIWISGFFGSGKSLFLKLLSLALAQEKIGGISVIDRLTDRCEDRDFRRAVAALKTRKPARVIALHMKSDAHDREQIVDILWRALHVAFGYARIPWIAEVERSLVRRGLFAAFKDAVRDDRSLPWEQIRTDALLQEAVLAKALLRIDPQTYPDLAAAGRAVREAREQMKTGMTPAHFTQRCLELLAEDREHDRLFFALDEMGQFAANDSGLLLELQVIVEYFNRPDTGAKLWLAATAQEQLDQVVANYAERQDDVHKIRDRFVRQLRVELSAENAERVVLERLLKKSSAKEEALRNILQPNAAWIEHETLLHDVTHELRQSKLEAVLQSYPFVPSHFRLITLFMQGLAADTGGTADRTAKGPRALIAVTQQIAEGLAAQQVGALVSLDRVYDAMEGSIPTEDVAVVRLLAGESARPPAADRVLRIDYVLDVMGEKNAQTTRANLIRSSWQHVAEDGAAVGLGVDEALVFLGEKSFVRETGDSRGQQTYRFLRAFQRKLEDDVRAYQVTLDKIVDKARELTKDVLQLMQIGRSRVSYKGARSFTLVPVVDGEFVPADEQRLRVEVRSPRSKDATDPSAESVTKHAVIWASASNPASEDEVRTIVATSAVLAQRRERSTTDQERQQLQRAADDLDFRETKLRGRLKDAFLAGSIFVYGTPVAASHDAADAIVRTVVEKDFPALFAAPYAVEERDVATIFAPTRPKEGPLVALGLVESGDLSDRSAICTDLLGAIEGNRFRGGATGRTLITKMLEPPLGYENEQTHAAAATLWKLGKLKAFSSAGVELARDAEGERRFGKSKEFEKLGLERERALDPAVLRAAATLLEQHFDRKGGLELPRIARDAQAAIANLNGRIALVRSRVRNDVPQVQAHLAALAAAVDRVQNAMGDIGCVEVFVAEREPLGLWEAVLEPVEHIDVDVVADIERAKRLLGSHVIQTRYPELAATLRGLLEGPRPWNDVPQIRAASSKLVAAVKNDLERLHIERGLELAQAFASIDERARELGLTVASSDAALAMFDAMRCPGIRVGSDGSCTVCRATVDTIPDQIAAIPHYLADALRTLNEEQRRDSASVNGNGVASSPASERVSISAQARAGLPRILGSDADVERVIDELRNALVEALHKHGEVELAP